MLDLLFGGRRVRLDSPLSVEDATTRLQQEVAAPEWRAFENRPQMFVGTLAEDRFHIMRLVRGRNSFRPVIDGRLSPGGYGCRVDVQLKLPAVAIFACAVFLAAGTTMLWFAIPRALAVARDTAFVMTDTDVFVLLFLFLAPPMLLSALVVPTLEARKATRLLIRLFDSSTSTRDAANVR